MFGFRSIAILLQKTSFCIVMQILQYTVNHFAIHLQNTTDTEDVCRMSCSKKLRIRVIAAGWSKRTKKQQLGLSWC